MRGLNGKIDRMFKVIGRDVPGRWLPPRLRLPFGPYPLTFVPDGRERSEIPHHDSRWERPDGTEHTPPPGGDDEES